MCGARGAPGHGRARARDDGGQRAERRLLEAIAQRGDRAPRRRPATASRASVAATPNPTSAGRFSLPPRRPRSWPPPTQSGATPGARAQPQRARAPRAVQLVRGDARRCRRPARAGAGARGRTPARRRRAGGGACGRRAARAGGRCRRRAARVPSSLFTSISATTAVSGRTAAATALGADDAVGRRARRRPASQPSPASASAQRMTAGCSSALTTRWRPRAARAAPSTPSASASVPPLVNSSSPGSTSSAAATSPRAWSSARAAAAPRRVRRGGVGVQLRSGRRAARPAPRGRAPSRRRCRGRSSNCVTISPDDRSLAARGSLR